MEKNVTIHCYLKVHMRKKKFMDIEDDNKNYEEYIVRRNKRIWKRKFKRISGYFIRKKYNEEIDRFFKEELWNEI